MSPGPAPRPGLSGMYPASQPMARMTLSIALVLVPVVWLGQPSVTGATAPRSLESGLNPAASPARGTPPAPLYFYADSRIRFGYPKSWHVSHHAGSSRWTITLTPPSTKARAVRITFIAGGSGTPPPDVVTQRLRAGIHSRADSRLTGYTRKFRLSTDVPAYRIEALRGRGAGRKRLTYIVFLDDSSRVGIIELTTPVLNRNRATILRRIVDSVTLPHGD